jgi:hypothetical protein
MPSVCVLRCKQQRVASPDDASKADFHFRVVFQSSLHTECIFADHGVMARECDVWADRLCLSQYGKHF